MSELMKISRDNFSYNLSNINKVCLIKIIIILLFTISSSNGLCSDILQKIYTLDDLRFNSFSSDGKHFIFTRYDNTGNRYELVFYDLKEKKPVITIPDLPPNTKYLFSDAKYIFVNEPRLRNELTIIDKYAPQQGKRISIESKSLNLKRESKVAKKRSEFTGSISQVFTIGKKLYILSNSICFIYDLMTFNLLATEMLEESRFYHNVGSKIIGIGSDIVVYDENLKLMHSVNNNLQCQLGSSGSINGRLFFSDICGKIYEYDINENARKVVIDLGKLELKTGLHTFSSLNFDINNEGLLIAVHSNKETYPKLIDIKSGKLLKTINLNNIPDYSMIDNDNLYYIYSDWLGKKSKIEVYSINKAVLNHSNFYAANLKEEYERSLRVYNETKDYYNALSILEDANIALILDGQEKVDENIRISMLNDYAYFLSLTYERYREGIPLLEKVIEHSPQQTNAYINLADVYYKLYKYDKSNKAALQKAIDYYEIYKIQMNNKGESNKILQRKYSVVDINGQVKSLNIDIQGGHLSNVLFWQDKMFAGDGWCYDRDEYLSAYAYNRNNYSLIKKLQLLKCDDEQQDSFSSINVRDNKLYVRTGYRYGDEKRPNLYIFDLNDYKLLKKYNDKSTDLKKELWGMDLSYVENDNIQYIKDAIQKGIKFEHVDGYYKANNKKYLITSGIDKEKKFNVYNLQTSEINRNIELMKERASFYLFDDLDKVVIQYFSSVNTLVEIYNIKNKQRRQIFSLENDPGRLGSKAPVLTTYKHYLILAHRRDIIFFDARKMQVVDIVKNIIPEFKTEGEANNHRIYKLIIDREKNAS